MVITKQFTAEQLVELTKKELRADLIEALKDQIKAMDQVYDILKVAASTQDSQMLLNFRNAYDGEIDDYRRETSLIKDATHTLFIAWGDDK